MIRLSEGLLLGYFAYTSLLALILPLASSIRIRTLLVNLGIFLLYASLLRVAARKPRKSLEITRDWLPTPFMLLAYKEMGWFAQPHKDFALERAWVEWDRLILRDWGGQALIESAGLWL